MSDQAAAPLPLKKQLWRQIVRAKILSQRATLLDAGAEAGGFELLARKVRSGDPDNVEAEAARRYWPLLFGREFRRDQDGGGLNAMLNYGYAIIRAGVARAVIAAGLHPSLGLKHCNRGNAMVLVDDLMEPFRPLVDREVLRLKREGAAEVVPAVKQILARLVASDVETPAGVSPVVLAMERLAQSLAKAYSREGRGLEFPRPGFAVPPHKEMSDETTAGG